MQRGDTELAVRDLEGAGAEARFPAPWPRRYGSVAVSPAGDVAVFAGVHALRAVDSTGAVLWEIRHGCWSAAVCTTAHASFSEYADDYHHGHADSGSAAFSSDGKVLWAHVRGHMGHDTEEEWLILDAADGSLLARVATMTVGSGSFHFPHPDPAYMGLSIAEGEESSPVLWGRWDGTQLTVQRFVEEVFLAVSPSGEHFLTTDTGQWALYLHQAEDGTELRRLNAGDAVPLLRETTALAGTSKRRSRTTTSPWPAPSTTRRSPATGSSTHTQWPCEDQSSTPSLSRGLPCRQEKTLGARSPRIRPLSICGTSRTGNEATARARCSKLLVPPNGGSHRDGSPQRRRASSPCSG
ncbi:hypothetical protein SAMN04489713_105216 [Actinomadura madurae]|uniref:Uncharacterized protein n=1 Tax=Actinomadura madurae TaxID=1993 RepID=A0A1I5GHT2_9ACTN|nr:hypothetical protein SAMN04489713_105216 [Actinomadura madurae]